MLILSDSEAADVIYYLDDLIVGYENLSEEVEADELEEVRILRETLVERFRGQRGKEF
jgi:hypothetical protein